MSSLFAALKENNSGLSILLALVGCLLLLVLTGCQTTKVDKWKPVRSQHKNHVHTVQWQAENLEAIAKWYTGSEGNWKAIANANPNILPGSLNQGDRIFIPSNLLKTKAPMSQAFVDEWLRLHKQNSKSGHRPKQGELAPMLVPKLHKLKQGDEEGGSHPQPPDLQEPEEDGGLELFGPK